MLVILQVGVDVEETSRLLKTDVLKLASRKFSATEAAALAKLECSHERHSRFVELWTLKVSACRVPKTWALRARPFLARLRFSVCYASDDIFGY